MQFIVAKQIEVEAETTEEAVAKANSGKTISVSARLKPPPAETDDAQKKTGQ